MSENCMNYEIQILLTLSRPGFSESGMAGGDFGFRLPPVTSLFEG